MDRISWITTLLVGGAVATVEAGSAPWVIDSGQGVVSIITSTTSASSGTLIGDWDPEANPTGTQTRPGAFGGSGNNPVSLNVNHETDGSGSFSVVGTFELNIDIELGVIAISGLQLQTEAGSSVPIENTFGLNFETFRSISPDSFYLGGIEIPIPLGSGELTAWSFEQTELSAGALAPGDDPGTWTFSLPTVLSVSASGTLQDAPFEFPSTLLPAVLVGVYIDGEAPVVQWSFSELLDETQQFDPPIQLPDVPLELPTVLPPGSFAGVILSMTADSAGFTFGSDVSITARPQVVEQPGDVNGDGGVGVDDLLLVISSWGACTGCAADLDGDDRVGVNDLLNVLQYWGT